MATLPVQYDTQFSQAVADIAPIETAFFDQHGRYQQFVNLSEAGLTEPADVTVWVDVYQAPTGHGYVVEGQAMVDGVTFTRSFNVGPETYRTSDGWLVVEM